MATSQDFANWICGDGLYPAFLARLFIAEADALLRFASGAVHSTIYYPELKALHICLPPLDEQKRIVAALDSAFEGIDTAIANAHNQIKLLGSLKKSIMRKGFTGQLDQPVGEGSVETAAE